MYLYLQFIIIVLICKLFDWIYLEMEKYQLLIILLLYYSHYSHYNHYYFILLYNVFDVNVLCPIFLLFYIHIHVFPLFSILHQTGHSSFTYLCLPFLFEASFLLHASFTNSKSVDKHKEGLSSVVLSKENTRYPTLKSIWTLLYYNLYKAAHFILFWKLAVSKQFRKFHTSFFVKTSSL